MAVLVPVLPVVSDAAAVLEGMDKVDPVDAGVVEPVASEPSFLPATDKGGLACDCGARCEEDRILLICLLVIWKRHTFGRGGRSADTCYCSEDGSKNSELVEDVELHVGLICENFCWVLLRVCDL